MVVAGATTIRTETSQNGLSGGPDRADRWAVSLYDALRDAGVDLQRAHRLDAYLRATGDDTAPAGFARTLLGDHSEVDRLRATLTADLEAITAGLELLVARSGEHPPRPAPRSGRVG